MTEETVTSDKLRKLPFYLVCDVSWSMNDEGRIDAVNRAIADIQEAIEDEPLLADLAYFSLIDFSDDARVVIPLGNLAEQHMTERTLATRGGTSYAAAFTVLRQTIESDVLALKANFEVFRPTVFFLSDGAPGDPSRWPAAFANLTEYNPENLEGL